MSYKDDFIESDIERRKSTMKGSLVIEALANTPISEVWDDVIATLIRGGFAKKKKEYIGELILDRIESYLYDLALWDWLEHGEEYAAQKKSEKERARELGIPPDELP